MQTHGRIMRRIVSLWEKEGTAKCTASGSLLCRYHAHRLSTMEDVAIKETSMRNLNQVCVELIMQYSIPHTNIVSIGDCYSWDKSLYVGSVFLYSLDCNGVYGPRQSRRVGGTNDPVVRAIHCLRLQECSPSDGCYSPHAPHPPRSFL